MNSKRLSLVVFFSCLFSLSAHARSIGGFVVAPDSIAGTAEEGRVLFVADATFSQITAKAKIGDTVEIEGEQYEVLVNLPSQVLTVMDKRTRSEVRVMVTAAAQKK